MSLWLQLEQAGVGESRPLNAVLDVIPWNADGLIAAIAQQHDTREVLMLAWRFANRQLIRAAGHRH